TRTLSQTLSFAHTLSLLRSLSLILSYLSFCLPASLSLSLSFHSCLSSSTPFFRSDLPRSIPFCPSLSLPLPFFPSIYLSCSFSLSLFLSLLLSLSRPPSASLCHLFSPGRALTPILTS